LSLAGRVPKQPTATIADINSISNGLLKSITIESKGQIRGDIPNDKTPNTNASKFLDSDLGIPRLKLRHPQKIVTQIPKEGCFILRWCAKGEVPHPQMRLCDLNWFSGFKSGNGV
jgi:hypothetical protein